jgi:hypothetical protein
MPDNLDLFLWYRICYHEWFLNEDMNQKALAQFEAYALIKYVHFNLRSMRAHGGQITTTDWEDKYPGFRAATFSV